MKTTFFHLFLLTALLAVASCQNKPTPPADNHAQLGTDDSVSQVIHPALSAQSDMNFYDTLWGFIADSLNRNHADPGAIPVPIKGFTIRAIDLFTAMGFTAANMPTPTYDHIRVYLGYSQESNQFKLFILPVDSANLAAGNSGTDIFLHQNGTPYPTEKTLPYPPDYLNDKFVLDLNAPCPSICDGNTPLITK